MIEPWAVWLVAAWVLVPTGLLYAGRDELIFEPDRDLVVGVVLLLYSAWPALLVWHWWSLVQRTRGP